MTRRRESHVAEWASLLDERVPEESLDPSEADRGVDWPNRRGPS
ncbi:MAG: hypothetical protein ABEJ40_08335 [Haloarculaceae archaeon]